jgi:hypothetical protein
VIYNIFDETGDLQLAGRNVISAQLGNISRPPIYICYNSWMEKPCADIGWCTQLGPMIDRRDLLGGVAEEEL